MNKLILFVAILLGGCTAIYLKSGDASPVDIEVHENTTIEENR